LLFFCWYLDLNSEPHTCCAGTLPPEPPYQPFLFCFSDVLDRVSHFLLRADLEPQSYHLCISHSGRIAHACLPPRFLNFAICLILHFSPTRQSHCGSKTRFPSIGSLIHSNPESVSFSLLNRKRKWIQKRREL
jgi:hypothetical protein